MTTNPQGTDMIDPNKLLHDANEWFSAAIRQYCQEAPDQTKQWLSDFEAGRARAVLHIEIVPTQEIRCGFQVDDKLITFHRVPLREVPGPQH